MVIARTVSRFEPSLLRPPHHSDPARDAARVERTEQHRAAHAAMAADAVIDAVIATPRHEWRA